MEDAAIHELDIGDGNSLFAVFDGHGGPEVSKFVAKIFVPLLKSCPEYLAKKYVEALDITFKKVDQQILSPEGAARLNEDRKVDHHNGEPVSNGTGCTANVLLITPDKYYVANAGDSRSSLCRNGKAFDLSNDHKPEDPIEKNRIEKAGGNIVMGRVNGGLNLTRSFGDFDYKKKTNLSYAEQMITCKPDIKQKERSSEDEFIVLGCDGIWEKYVNNSQGLIDLIREDYKVKGEAGLRALT